MTDTADELAPGEAREIGPSLREQLLMDPTPPPDALLEENPDGVRQWAQRSGLFGRVLPLDEGQIRIAGRRTHWYRLEGTPAGLGPSEITLVRIRRGGYNVVLMAVHPRGNEAERTRALRTLRAVENP